MNALKHLTFFCMALCLCTSLNAQIKAGEKIKANVFYLLPEFGEGTVYFRGQAPAKGTLNICAVDNTLRFIDENGTELAAENNEDIVMVQIDNVSFLHDVNGFYRMYPASSKIGIALKRTVEIMRGAKVGAYGTIDRTSSIRQYATLYTESGAVNLNTEYPHQETETLYIYMGNAVFPFTKKSMMKLFPSKKEEIKAYFKAGHSMPDNVDDAVSLLKRFTAD